MSATFVKIGISYKGEQECYYSYGATHRIHNFGKQRLVSNFSHADLSDSLRFYTLNCWRWQAVGITRIRRYRWPVEHCLLFSCWIAQANHCDEGKP
ncbi:MAG: hypothetical protein JXA21_23065 [Anaerolineae bacterium]|nr:hypothetical protein [Anaerolineae bacterium]